MSKNSGALIGWASPNYKILNEKVSLLIACFKCNFFKDFNQSTNFIILNFVKLSLKYRPIEFSWRDEYNNISDDTLMKTLYTQNLFLNKKLENFVGTPCILLEYDSNVACISDITP